MSRRLATLFVLAVLVVFAAVAGTASATGAVAPTLASTSAGIKDGG